MDRHPTETRQQEDAYAEGVIDADNATGVDLLHERITRARAFRMGRGRRLRPGTLTRLGLDDLISVN